MSKSTDTRAAALELAEMLPAPGTWSAEDYLWLTGRTNQLVELADGWLEVLPMPSERHQRILLALYRLLHAHVGARGGIILVAPLRLRLADRRFREPDLLLLLDAADPRRGERFWTGADLVIEVLSPDDPDRDLVVKREEYAAAGIGEYWIADPEHEAVMVLGRAEGGSEPSSGTGASNGRGHGNALESAGPASSGRGFVELGRHWVGDRVMSKVLPDIELVVEAAFTD